ncbi:MAG: WD40 repeat domain-containing protein, partial [Nitrospira sp.]|nr:WD40 repeat domain-containing protein [Nitrospira sp.]
MDPAGRPYTKILSMAFSPDNSVLALGNTDKSVTLWNFSEGKRTQTLSESQDIPQTIAYSLDGRFLGIAGNTITLWDIENNKIRQYTPLATSPIQSLSFSSDGQMLAAGSLDNKITLWNLKDQKPEKVLEAPEGPITSLAFSKDDPVGPFYLAAGGTSPGHPILVWDLKSGRLVKSLRGPGQKIHNLVFRPDGKQLAVVSDNILVWDVQTGDTFPVKLQNLSGNTPVAFSLDGGLLALSTRDAHIILWNTETKTVVRTLSSHKNPVQELLFSPDGQTLISVNHSEVILWNVQGGTVLTTFAEPEFQRKLLVFSPDGKFLASPTGPQHNLIALRSLESG